MKTIKLYSYSELNTEAQEKAQKIIMQDIADDPYLMESNYHEMKESMQAIATASGVKTLDYEYGVHCHGSKWKIAGYWIDEHLKGNKALAHFLNVLIKAGYERPRHFLEMKFPGICGFTGMGYDDCICESIWDSLLQGETIKTAFNLAADEICRILEEEWEWFTEPENVCFEEALNGGECFTKEGEKIDY